MKGLHSVLSSLAIVTCMFFSVVCNGLEMLDPNSCIEIYRADVLQVWSIRKGAKICDSTFLYEKDDFKFYPIGNQLFISIQNKKQESFEHWKSYLNLDDSNFTIAIHVPGRIASDFFLKFVNDDASVGQTFYEYDEKFASNQTFAHHMKPDEISCIRGKSHTGIMRWTLAIAVTVLFLPFIVIKRPGPSVAGMVGLAISVFIIFGAFRLYITGALIAALVVSIIIGIACFFGAYHIRKDKFTIVLVFVLAGFMLAARFIFTVFFDIILSTILVALLVCSKTEAKLPKCRSFFKKLHHHSPYIALVAAYPMVMYSIVYERATIVGSILFKGLAPYETVGSNVLIDVLLTLLFFVIVIFIFGIFYGIYKEKLHELDLIGMDYFSPQAASTGAGQAYVEADPPLVRQVTNENEVNNRHQ